MPPTPMKVLFPKGMFYVTDRHSFHAMVLAHSEEEASVLALEKSREIGNRSFRLSELAIDLQEQVVVFMEEPKRF